MSAEPSLGGDQRKELSRGKRWAKSKRLRSQLNILHHQVAEKGVDSPKLRESLEKHLPVLCENLEHLIKSDPLGVESCRRQRKILRIFRSVLKLSVTSGALKRESFDKWLVLIIKIIEQDMWPKVPFPNVKWPWGWENKVWWQCMENALLVLNDMLSLSIMSTDGNKKSLLKQFADWYYVAHLSRCKRTILKLLKSLVQNLPTRVRTQLAAYLDLALKCPRTRKDFFEIKNNNYHSGSTKIKIIDDFLLRLMEKNGYLLQWIEPKQWMDSFGLKVTLLRIEQLKLEHSALKALLLNFCKKSRMLSKIILDKYTKRLMRPDSEDENALIVITIILKAGENWFDLESLDRLRAGLRNVTHMRRSYRALRYLYQQDTALKLKSIDRAAEDAQLVKEMLLIGSSMHDILMIKAEAMLCDWAMQKTHSTLDVKTVEETKPKGGGLDLLRGERCKCVDCKEKGDQTVVYVNIFHEFRLTYDCRDRNFWASIVLLDIIGASLTSYAAYEPIAFGAQVAIVTCQLLEPTLATSSSKLLVAKATDLKLKMANLQQIVRKKFSEESNTLEELARQCKLDGNENFKRKVFREAIVNYTIGLDYLDKELDQTAQLKSVLYSNRAACYVMSNEHQKAIDDCKQALRINPTNMRARQRMEKSLSKLRI